MGTRHLLSVLAAVSVLGGTLCAQNYRGGYFLDGYLYGYKLNPAYSNDTDFVGPVLGQSVLSVKSKLSLKDFVYPTDEGLVTGLNDLITPEEFLPRVEDYSPVILEEDLTFFALGLRKGNRYHTWDATVRTATSLAVPYDMWEFLKVGTQWQDSFDMKDFFVNTHTWLEMSYGQSIDLGDRLTVGGRAKLLLGMTYGYIETQQMDVMLNQEAWMILGQSRMEIAGKGIKYKMKEDPKGKTPDQVDIGSVNLNPAGFLGVAGLGASIDLGAKWKITPHLTLSGAILDFGGIKWFDQVYARTPSVDYRTDPDKLLPDREDSAVGSFSALYSFYPEKKHNSFDWMTFTANCCLQYNFPFYDKLGVGVVGIYRTDEILHWWEVRPAINYNPFKWVSITANAGYSTYGMSYGLSANFVTDAIRIFIGTDAYVHELTPQLVPLTKLNNNFVFGLGIPIHNKERRRRR